MSNTNNELWQNFVPEEQHFKIRDYEITIPANMDLFNDYKKYFANLAHNLKSLAQDDYNKQITDLKAFYEEANEIYCKYLDLLGDKVMDILVANGIYDSTKEEIVKRNGEISHLAYDYYVGIVEKVNGKSEQKAAMAASMWDFMNPRTGGIIASKENYASEVRSAKMNNALISAFGNIAVKRSRRLTKGEQDKLYKEISPSIYFKYMENDFSNMYMIVVSMLRVKKDIDIWMPPAKTTLGNAKNVLKNISNPNFPQDNKMQAFTEIFLANPYNEDCIKFLENEYGSDEVQELKEYLGYIKAVRKCPSCGAEVEDGTRFCADCGSPLEG